MARVECFKRTASKHVYYLWWNRSPAQVGCMRQVLGPGALGRPRGIGWRGRWEEGSGWGTHVNPWLIHVNVWQNPLQLKKKIKTTKKRIREWVAIFSSRGSPWPRDGTQFFCIVSQGIVATEPPGKPQITSCLLQNLPSVTFLCRYFSQSHIYQTMTDHLLCAGHEVLVGKICRKCLRLSETGKCQGELI